ncbi:uncharacterized protein LOC34622676 [Cyclospora cayetanensis]|uniref:Uncharacterized protein LOC34622676 n=1 Tax=Cyclospora cayetanensis TaxID=88456 RepID=A0A6P6RYT6_9EIME|nr:uncharacterized protein LOC34622676 [Cyclospora cayetanensis]
MWRAAVAAASRSQAFGGPPPRARSLTLLRIGASTAAAAESAAPLDALGCAYCANGRLRSRGEWLATGEASLLQRGFPRCKYVQRQQHRGLATESISAILRQMEREPRSLQLGKLGSGTEGLVAAASGSLLLCEGLAAARLGDALFVKGLIGGDPSRVGVVLELWKKHVLVGLLQDFPSGSTAQAGSKATGEGGFAQRRGEAASSIEELLQQLQRQQLQAQDMRETALCSLVNSPIGFPDGSACSVREVWGDCSVSVEVLSPAAALLQLHQEAAAATAAAAEQLYRPPPALQLWRACSTRQRRRGGEGSQSASCTHYQRPPLLLSGWAPLDALLPVGAGDVVLLHGPFRSGKTSLMLHSVALWLQQLAVEAATDQVAGTAPTSDSAAPTAVLVLLGLSGYSLAQQLRSLRAAFAAARQQMQQIQMRQMRSQQMQLKVLYVAPGEEACVSAFVAPLLGLRLAQVLQRRHKGRKGGAAVLLAADGLHVQAAAAAEVSNSLQQLAPAGEATLRGPLCFPHSMYGLLASDEEGTLAAATPASSAQHEEAHVQPLTRIFCVDTEGDEEDATATTRIASSFSGASAVTALASLSNACVSLRSGKSSSIRRGSAGASVPCVDWSKLLQQSPQRVLADAFSSLSSCCFSPAFSNAAAASETVQLHQAAVAAAEALVRVSRSSSPSSRAAAQPLLLRIAAAAFLWQQHQLQQEGERQHLLKQLRLHVEDHEAEELRSLRLAAAVVAVQQRQPPLYRSLPEQLLLLRAAAFYFFDPFHDSCSSSTISIAKKAATFSEQLLQQFPATYPSLWTELQQHLHGLHSLASEGLAGEASTTLQHRCSPREAAVAALLLLRRIDEALFSLRESFSLTRTLP